MNEQMKNILIGLFVIVAILSAVLTILFLEPRVGDGKKLIRARFSNISGINIGTRVNLAGKAVGEVDKIEEVATARGDQVDPLGRVYFYELILKVDSSVQIYNTDVIAIRTTGLLGEKSIAIIPMAPKKGQIPKLLGPSDIIYAESVDPLEFAFYQISELAEKFESAVGNFDQWFTENYQELSQAVKSFSDVLGEANITLKSINEEDLVTSVKDAVDTFGDNMRLIRDTLEQMQQKEMVDKFDKILTNFYEASESIKTEGPEILVNLNTITKEIAEGKGSIGKLIKSEDFYLRLTAVMSKINTMMNDINHYGLLFQYDKHWQRIRTKRANILQALDTPKEFRNYFETEIDAITTSLERVSILLDKAENTTQRRKILCDPVFQKDFATLLRNVEGIMDSLKLYNEQLLDTTQDP